MRYYSLYICFYVLLYAIYPFTKSFVFECSFAGDIIKLKLENMNKLLFEHKQRNKNVLLNYYIYSYYTIVRNETELFVKYFLLTLRSLKQELIFNYNFVTLTWKYFV